jgi:predicted dehydrogenase
MASRVRAAGAPVRVGLVGYGYWGSKHARVLAGLPGVELVIIEGDAQRRRAARGSFPTAGFSSTLDEVQGDLDAVVIATPPRTHAPLAIQALHAGLHTLVEKPLATSVPEAEDMVAAANAAGRILMVGHTYEYNAGIWQLKNIIDSGELGRVLYIDTSRLNLGLYQSDCNVIWDLVPHDVSIVSYLLDEFPETVSVWAQRNLAGMYEDIAHVRLGFKTSAAFVHVSWLHPSKVRTITVVGDRKMAVYDDLSDTDRIRIYDKSVGLPDSDAPVPSMPVTYRTGNITSPYVEFAEPLLVQDSHFLECIRTGHSPRSVGERGLEVVRVLSATDDAIASDRTVRIQRSAKGADRVFADGGATS